MTAPRWAPTGPGHYGLSSGPLSSTTTELNAVANPSRLGAAEGSVLSLHNPLTVFTLLGAITFGLMGFSTSGRVGSARVSLSAGKS